MSFYGNATNTINSLLGSKILNEKAYTTLSESSSDDLSILVKRGRCDALTGVCTSNQVTRDMLGPASPRGTTCLEFLVNNSCTTWTRSVRADVELLMEGEVTSNKEKSMGQKTFWYSNKDRTSNYAKKFLAAIYVWKSNIIFGNGIKSFHVACNKLAGPNINLEEDEVPGKKNLSCAPHPHNYYFQILVTTGIIGLFIIFVIGLLFSVFTFKNFKFIKKFDMANIILLSAIISFFLETFPIRSTGSLYSSANATYIILIGSIIVSYKKLLKIK